MALHFRALCYALPLNHIIMQLLKKLGRILIISIFIILASFGIGVFGVNFRESFINKETRIEMVEKKNDEDIGEDEQNEIKE